MIISSIKLRTDAWKSSQKFARAVVLGGEGGDKFVVLDPVAFTLVAFVIFSVFWQKWKLRHKANQAKEAFDSFPRCPHLFLISFSKDMSLSYPNSPPAGRGTFMMSACVATSTTWSGFFSFPPKAGGREQTFHRQVILLGFLLSPGEVGCAGQPAVQDHIEKTPAHPNAGGARFLVLEEDSPEVGQHWPAAPSQLLRCPPKWLCLPWLWAGAPLEDLESPVSTAIPRNVHNRTCGGAHRQPLTDGVFG